MTIASEITKLNTNLTNCYTAVDNKGGTLPQAQNFDNLATAISSISGGSSPVITSLNVTPTTSAQTITAPSGTDGYSPVNVSAVTSSIDNNIVASNIKSGVSILGVSGSVVALNGSTKTVTPTTFQQTVTPTSPSNGLTSVTVNAVTSSIDANITAGNIKKDVQILGVTGTYEGSGSSTLITKSITQNGTYNASSDNADGYSSVTVNVPSSGGIGITREVSANGVFQMPTTSFTFSLPNAATNLGQYAMYYAFYYCTGLTSVNLNNLTTISGNYAMEYAFQNCTGLTSINLSNLTTISGQSAMQYVFRYCTGLTSVDFSSLTTISGRSAMYYAFSGCTGLTSVNLSSLTTISGYQAMGYAFQGCKKLTTLSFPSLISTGFGSNTNQFNSMLSGVTGCTVHFPSNLQSKIGSWSSVTGGFGGTNTTVLFDLPATS